MIHVVAKDMCEYNGFLATKPSPTDYRYVYTIDSLRGLYNIDGLFIGTCYDRPDFSTILNMINTMRHRNGKSIIHIDQVSHLTRYQTTDHSLLTTVPSWSQNNIPVANAGVATSYDLFNKHAAKTYTGFEATTIAPTTRTNRYGDIATSFKVPLSTNTTASESMFILKVAKMYKSYITNSYNAMDNTIEHFFNMKDDAVHFAKVYNAVAYEYN